MNVVTWNNSAGAALEPAVKAYRKADDEVKALELEKDARVWELLHALPPPPDPVEQRQRAEAKEKLLAHAKEQEPEEDPVTFARTTWRVLALLRERVKLIQRILRGSSSPLAALGTENEIAVTDQIPGDVTIPLWSSHDTLQRRELDLKKAKARVEREQPERERLAKPRLAIVPRPRTSCSLPSCTPVLDRKRWRSPLSTSPPTSAS